MVRFQGVNLANHLRFPLEFLRYHIQFKSVECMDNLYYDEHKIENSACSSLMNCYNQHAVLIFISRDKYLPQLILFQNIYYKVHQKHPYRAITVNSANGYPVLMGGGY